MERKSKRHHVIDFIFPIALFFVFAVSALIVILLATNIYKSVTENSQELYTSRTALSYISEKVRQNDTAGAISIGTLDGADSLIIKETINNTTYTTYIYEQEHMLKELYIKEGVKPSLNAGKDILEIKNFQAKKITDTLFKFTIVTDDGTTDSVTIGLKSRLGGNTL